ncbi:hypothetical protein LSH36_111g04030 [Paralvinella palmiformis]|uniref:BHLH domain-containing protein n=1 Tax=Paralvinella palmiformis TaxID=53620 RepID=A0AAD9JZD4_9ANNE|nr:hypothetical protein LSH36_111g04030 [Paralvinella palmiformis]
MSDDDRDIDVESDEEDDLGVPGVNTQFMTQAEKRAHHNALERKRRDHIKDSFHSLRDSIPSLQGEKIILEFSRFEHSSVCVIILGGQNTFLTSDIISLQASRAMILKQATDYIQFMAKKNGSIQADIDDLKRQTAVLEQQVRALEKAKTTGSFAVQSSALCASPTFGGKSNLDLGTDSDSSSSGASLGNRRKRLKKTNS